MQRESQTQMYRVAAEEPNKKLIKFITPHSRQLFSTTHTGIVLLFHKKVQILFPSTPTPPPLPLKKMDDLQLQHTHIHICHFNSFIDFSHLLLLSTKQLHAHVEPSYRCLIYM